MLCQPNTLLQVRYLKCIFFSHFTSSSKLHFAPFSFPFPSYLLLLVDSCWISLIKPGLFCSWRILEEPTKYGFIISPGESEASNNECSEFFSISVKEPVPPFLPRHPHRRALACWWEPWEGWFFSPQREVYSEGCLYHRTSPPARSGNLQRSSLWGFPLHVSSTARTPQIWPYNELSM